jgi:hypothetical protein
MVFHMVTCTPLQVGTEGFDQAIKSVCSGVHLAVIAVIAVIES